MTTLGSRPSRYATHARNRSTRFPVESLPPLPPTLALDISPRREITGRGECSAGLAVEDGEVFRAGEDFPVRAHMVGVGVVCRSRRGTSAVAGHLGLAVTIQVIDHELRGRFADVLPQVDGPHQSAIEAVPHEGSVDRSSPTTHCRPRPRHVNDDLVFVSVWVGDGGVVGAIAEGVGELRCTSFTVKAARLVAPGRRAPAAQNRRWSCSAAQPRRRSSSESRIGSLFSLVRTSWSDRAVDVEGDSIGITGTQQAAIPRVDTVPSCCEFDIPRPGFPSAVGLAGRVRTGWFRRRMPSMIADSSFRRSFWLDSSQFGAIEGQDRSGRSLFLE